MSMPILPALMGTEEATPVSLAELIQTLDDDQVNELIATAEAAGYGVEEAPAAEDVNDDLEQPEAGTVDNDEALSEEGVDDGGAAEDVGAAAGDDTDEELEEGAEEGDDEAVTEMEGLDPDAIVESAVSTFDGLDAQLVSLQGFLTTAEEAAEAGADPDSIQQLVDKAEELIEAADEAVTECKDAAAAEDVHTAAVSAMKVNRVQRILVKFVEQAQAFAETSDIPEPGPMDDPAVKVWAERMGPGKRGI